MAGTGSHADGVEVGVEDVQDQCYTIFLYHIKLNVGDGTDGLH